MDVLEMAEANCKFEEFRLMGYNILLSDSVFQKIKLFITTVVKA
jgi:hypothetical protein